jgi:cysteine-rich repeat protein
MKRGANKITSLSTLLLLSSLVVAACSSGSSDDDSTVADAAPGTPDAAHPTPDAAPDAAPGTPDATPPPDAEPGTPDATPTPDAAPPDASPPDATPPPPLPVCGNGGVEALEACDDGGNMPSDGCDAECAVEPGYTCSGTRSVCTPICGDMILVGAEGCDDGAVLPGDGCSATCTVERGYACTGIPSVCSAICGDAIVAGAETCDDGNTVASDCCDPGCHAEPGCESEINDTAPAADPVDTHFINDVVTGFIAPEGDVDFYVLTLPAGATSYALHLQTVDGPVSNCASDHIDSDIRLDDANGATLGENDDAGGNYCSIVDHDVPPGTYFIRVAAATAAAAGDRSFDYRLSLTATAVVCGDGTRTGGEACDDGNTIDGDGCSSVCTIDSTPETEPNDGPGTASGPLVPTSPAQGAISPIGDKDFYSFVVGMRSDVRLETFDLGGPGHCAAPVDTLIKLFGPDGTTQLVSDDDDGPGNCSAINPTSDAAARHLAPGTYYVSVEEFGNNALLPGYLLFVRFEAVCGNGVVERDEECDGTPGCTDACERVQVCGDGFIDAPETCDDGNTTAGDGCSATCAVESFPEVEPNDTAATAGGPLVTLAPAQGAITPVGDKDFYSFVLTQRSDVRLETFDLTGVGHCASTVDTMLRVYAPDGTTELVSDDDDGPGNCSTINPTADAAVRHLAPGTYYVNVEEFGNNALVPGYLLFFAIDAACGNGVVERDEECDGTPGCLPSCERVQVCGDGFVDAPEQCDDGNTSAGDGCDPTCQREQVCGNGTIELPEGCDDGNTTSGDGCTATCTLEPGHAYESEPNNSSATANPGDPLVRVHARINPAGDKDFYRIKLSQTGGIRVETFDNALTLGTCASIDTIIKLYAANGTTQLATDDDGGPGNCSKIDPATQTGAANLPAGDYYVSVEAYNNALIAGYQIVITIL